MAGPFAEGERMERKRRSLQVQQLASEMCTIIICESGHGWKI